MGRWVGQNPPRSRREGGGIEVFGRKTGKGDNISNVNKDNIQLKSE